VSSLGVAVMLTVVIILSNGPPEQGRLGIEITKTLKSSGPERSGKRMEYLHVTSGDTLTTNGFIKPGDKIVSPSGGFHANISRNGIFRVYKHDSFAGERAIYELGTPPMVQTQMGVRPGQRAEGDFYAMLQNDGNLVIQRGVDPRHKLSTVDSSSIHKKQEKGNYRAILNDDGSFVVLNETNNPLWWSPQALLFMGDFLEEGDMLVSPKGAYFTILTPEGLFTYKGYSMADPDKEKTFEWRVRKGKLSRREGAKIYATILESGDFQVFSAVNPKDKVRKIAMRSRTGGLKRQPMDTYFAKMSDEGELILYGGRGGDISNYRKIWSSYEACLIRAEVFIDNTVQYLPMAGPVWKELTAAMYSMKPWCKPMAQKRAYEGLKSMGYTLGMSAITYGINVYAQIKEKGLMKFLRVKGKNTEPTHYEILGVSRTADDEEIKRVFKKLSQDYHPDHFKTEEEMRKANDKFRKVTVAYETLMDIEKRATYDGELPMFDFTGPGKFFQTLGESITNCLGIQEEIIQDKDVLTSDALEAGLD